MEQSDPAILWQPDKPKTGRKMLLIALVVIVVLALLAVLFFVWRHMRQGTGTQQSATQQQMMDSLNAPGTEKPISQEAVNSLTASLNESASSSSPLSAASTSELLKSLSAQ